MDIRPRAGHNLRSIREAQGLSQEGLAFECNLHRTYISGVERGVRNPTILMLDKITKALKVPPADLLKEELGSGPIN